MTAQPQSTSFDDKAIVSPVAFETVETAIDIVIKGTDMPERCLQPHDIASWAAFLPTVHVGGALPVTFQPDGDHVVVEVIVPYVTPAPQPFADPNKIPLGIAEGFPVPLTMRYKLPAYSPVNAAHFIRHIVREIYHHEIDEQLCVNGSRPFAPEH